MDTARRASAPSDEASKWPLPASGAWHPGLGAAERMFFELSPDRPFTLEGGGTLTDPVLAYETWGALDADAANAVLVCHALTGDAHAHGHAHPPSQPTDGWWNDFIGPGRPLDTDRYYVVCANVLGGCQGSTGPSSVNPASGRRYGPDFPVVTNRDIVRSQRALGRCLGIDRWLAVVGGSMGGMTALEWGITYPSRLGALVVIASAAEASAQQIAWSKAGRQSILDDPNFRGGRYYDAADGEGPHRGLANARRIAMIHYRSGDEFDRRFARHSENPLLPLRLDHRFDVESYLDYQGAKFVPRFDANTYLVLNKLMDLHDVGRGRGGTDAALARIVAPTLVMSVRTDFLYPRPQQMRIVEALSRRPAMRVEHVDIDSDNGHDGFLTEPDQTGPPMGEFIDDVYKNSPRTLAVSR
ncbi:homoserine O-acetyltransferase MetX [Candidatus Poriferisodalis sp.]|uniref:homoserine O-acetyltransferase MetX n=1 Tax=Candidatus Poriferisodalis sp. TaxID=3101277 RepID=UPI003B017673